MFHDVTYIQTHEPHKMRIAVRFEPPKGEDVMMEAARVFDRHRREIWSARRNRDLVRARWAAMYAVSRLTRLSYPQMGRLFGKDHTTVMHGVQMASRIMNGSLEDAYDGEDFRTKVNKIMAHFEVQS